MHQSPGEVFRYYPVLGSGNQHSWFKLCLSKSKGAVGRIWAAAQVIFEIGGRNEPLLKS